MTINTELAKQWIAALRSGLYVQTKHRLRRNEPNGTSYCCLGVLCEVAKVPHSGSSSYQFPDEDNQEVHLDAACSNSWWDTNFGLALDQEACWTMNDEKEKSFTEIADYIEQKLDLKA